MNEKQRKLCEGYFECREVRCQSCGVIDLSDCDTVHEAREKWNKHVRTEHREGHDPGDRS
jgi:hypothetical protein